MSRLDDALKILISLGLPRAQQNERSALCLLALLDLRPELTWADAQGRLMGVTPIMDWVRDHYGIDLERRLKSTSYKPNSRETFRRQTIHQFVAAGIAVENPDRPNRPKNSPHFVYQIEPTALTLLRSFDTPFWHENLTAYLENHETLAARYARERKQQLVPVQIAPGHEIQLSPGKHSGLIRAIIEVFAPHFVRDGVLVYAGDTGKKFAYFNEPLLSQLGVTVDPHGKMPDAVLYYPEQNWLLLVEAVTSHGPVDGKRHAELRGLFAASSAGLVYVTAFPTRAVMARYISEIAWETEVWVADAPSHLIHFNGERFLGPYSPIPEGGV